MRIAIITPVFPPYHAGIGRVAEQEAEGLVEKGHQVTVFTPLYKKSDLEFNERLKDYKIRRLRTVLKFGNAAWLPSLADELKSFDVIHLHYPFIGAINSVLKSKILNHKSKIIITYHMDLVGLGWKRLFFKVYARLTLPRVIQSADKIIVSSLDYARHGDLAPYLAQEPAKFAEAPFGVELRITNYELRIKELKSRLSIKEGERVILFVGGLDKAHYFKGVDILLESFRDLISNIPARTTGVAGAGGQYPTSKLLIVGDGDLRSHYESQARMLGVAKSVIFAGRVLSEELDIYYQLADVFVLPSLDRSEAYGLVLLEAMAQAVPVVASDLSGVRTMVGPDRGLLARPGDAADLTRVLVEVLRDEEKRNKMGEAARRWVEENRSLEKEIQTIDKILRSC